MTVLEYFGLNEQPFRIGPDPRYLFYSAQVKEAIAKCEYMARDRVAPIYMYGPIGSGKTSILRRLNERLGADDRYHVAYVIAPNGGCAGDGGLLVGAVEPPGKIA